MRRLYESRAVERDDDDPFTPSERDTHRPQAMRTVPGTVLSRLLIPNSVRYRAVSVSVETPDHPIPAGSAVPFRVEMKNAMPFPVEVPTRSPVLWNWSVNGHPQASKVDPGHPEDPRAFHFDRGERKRFARRWRGYFRISDREWEPAAAGEHVIGAGLNVPEAETRQLYDEATVELVTDPEAPARSEAGEPVS